MSYLYNLIKSLDKSQSNQKLKQATDQLQAYSLNISTARLILVALLDLKSKYHLIVIQVLIALIPIAAPDQTSVYMLMPLITSVLQLPTFDYDENALAITRLLYCLYEYAPEDSIYTTEHLEKLTSMLLNAKLLQTDTKIEVEACFDLMVQKQIVYEDVLIQHLDRKSKTKQRLPTNLIVRAAKSYKYKKVQYYVFDHLSELLYLATYASQPEYHYYFVNTETKYECVETTVQSYLTLHALGLDKANCIYFMTIFAIINLDLIDHDKYISVIADKMSDQAKTFYLLTVIYLLKQKNPMYANAVDKLISYLSSYIMNGHLKPEHYTKLRDEGNNLIQYFGFEVNLAIDPTDPFFFVGKEFIQNENNMSFIKWDGLDFIQSVCCYYLLNTIIDRFAKKQVELQMTNVDKIFQMYFFFTDKFPVFDVQVEFLHNIFDASSRLHEQKETERVYNIIKHIVYVPNQYITISYIESQEFNEIEMGAAIQSIILDKLVALPFCYDFEQLNYASFCIALALAKNRSVYRESKQLMFSNEDEDVLAAYETDIFAPQSIYYFMYDFGYDEEYGAVSEFFRTFTEVYITDYYNIANFDDHFASIMKLCRKISVIRPLSLMQLSLEFEKTEHIELLLQTASTNDFKELVRDFDTAPVPIILICMQLFLYYTIGKQFIIDKLALLSKYTGFYCQGERVNLQAMYKLKACFAENIEKYTDLLYYNHLKNVESYIETRFDAAIATYVCRKLGVVLGCIGFYYLRLSDATYMLRLCYKCQGALYYHRYLAEAYAGLYSCGYQQLSVVEKQTFVTSVLNMLSVYGRSKLTTDALANDQSTDKLISVLCEIIMESKQQAVSVFESLVSTARNSVNVSFCNRALWTLLHKQTPKLDRQTQRNYLNQSVLAVFTAGTDPEVIYVITDYTVSNIKRYIYPHEAFCALTAAFKVFKKVSDVVFPNVVKLGCESVYIVCEDSVQKEILVNTAAGLQFVSRATLTANHQSSQYMCATVQFQQQNLIEILQLLAGFCLAYHFDRQFEALFVRTEYFWNANQSAAFMPPGVCVVLQSVTKYTKVAPGYKMLQLMLESVLKQSYALQTSIINHVSSNIYFNNDPSDAEVTLFITKMGLEKLVANSSSNLLLYLTRSSDLSRFFFSRAIDILPVAAENVDKLALLVVKMVASDAYELVCSPRNIVDSDDYYYEVYPKFKIYEYPPHVVKTRCLDVLFVKLRREIIVYYAVRKAYLGTLDLFSSPYDTVTASHQQFLDFFIQFVENGDLRAVFRESATAIVKFRAAAWWYWRYLNKIRTVCGFE